jgi:hypothetical protein
MTPNPRLQRTGSRPPLSRQPLGSGSIGGLVGLALVVGAGLFPSVASAQVRDAKGNPFRGVIAVEKNSAPLGPVVRMEWTPIQLSHENVETLRRVLRSARARGLSEEAEARKTKQVTGGVPGCMSSDFRVTFGETDRTWSGILHLSCGWFRADERDLGAPIVFSSREEALLTLALRTGP